MFQRWLFFSPAIVPGGIAPESLTFTPLDDMIFLKWEEPVEPNGLITQYEVGHFVSRANKKKNPLPTTLELPSHHTLILSRCGMLFSPCQYLFCSSSFNIMTQIKEKSPLHDLKRALLPLFDFPQACFFFPFLAQMLVAHMSLSLYSGEDPLFTVHGIYCTCSYGNEAEAQTSGCNYMGDNHSNYLFA